MTAARDPWGECVGTAELCVSGRVIDHPDYPRGFDCTGGKHVAPGQYIRCTSEFHRRPVPDPATMALNHDVAVLVRLAAELESLADQTDAAGRLEGPGLRADAADLRRMAVAHSNAIIVPAEGLRWVGGIPTGGNTWDRGVDDPSWRR